MVITFLCLIPCMCSLLRQDKPVSQVFIIQYFKDSMPKDLFDVSKSLNFKQRNGLKKIVKFFQHRNSTVARIYDSLESVI